ncbi:nSTAND1 domain-containing NTPase [Geomonas azotofigens]|uniref:nSTAND1 domain-containing NTPase n=1 Tax=Geomonas azotofigens TaxID=2843196 RepID=UPI001C1154FB|nr:tetratricopeptide repeat protein [Geomonas azotofigens]MBU5611434.1 hypothetical protein [Geomonas azotofigens]
MSETNGAFQEQKLPEKPYVGMRPYEKNEKMVFLGRDRDAAVIRDKVFSSNLTVLYGPSGIGKSSILRTLLVPSIEEQDARVIYFEDWRAEDPCATLKGRLVEEARRLQVPSPEAGAPTLAELARLLISVDDKTLVLILDQFEEFFTSHGRELDPLRKEVGALVRTSKIDVRVLLSLREEHLASLEPFRPEVLNLFQSTYRLEPLAGRDIRELIERPAGLFGVKYETELVERLVVDLLQEGPRGSATDAFPSPDTPVDLPVLQLVCDELWSERGRAETLPLELYQRLDGRQGIVERYLRRVMPQRWSDARLTALLMRHLAPPDGHKVSYSARHLASLCNFPQQRVTAELERLSGSEVRVLRSREYEGGSVLYELWHDSFIRIISPWCDGILKRDKKRRLAWRLMAAAGIVSVIISVLFMGLATRKNAQERTEELVGFLIGEDFLGRLRPFGRSEVNRDVQRQVDLYLNERNRMDLDSDAHLRNHGLSSRNHGNILADRGDLAGAKEQYRESVATFQHLHEKERDNPVWMVELARSLGKLGEAGYSQGQLTEAIRVYRSALQLWERAVSLDPAHRNRNTRELAECHNNIAVVLADQGELKQALKHYDEVLAKVEPLMRIKDESRNAEALKTYYGGLDGKSRVLQDLGDEAGARQYFSQSSDIVKLLVTYNPLAADARKLQAYAIWRGVTMRLDDTGWEGWQGAMKEYRQMERRFQQLVIWDESNVLIAREWAITQSLIAGAISVLGRQDEALAALDSSQAKMEELIRTDPSNVWWQGDLANVYLSRGDILARGGRRADAAAAFAAGTSYLEKVVTVDPTNTRFWSDLASSLQSVGGMAAPREAVRSYRRAREIADGLANRHPEALSYRLLQLSARRAEAESLIRSGDKSGAVALLAVHERMVKAALANWPGSIVVQKEMSLLWNDRADIAAQEKKPAEAAAACLKSISGLEKFAEARPRFASVQELLRDGYRRLGDIYLEEKRMSLAIDAYHRAGGAAKKTAELYPEQAAYRHEMQRAYLSLAEAYSSHGDNTAAITEYGNAIAAQEEAVRLAPRNADYRTALASLHSRICNAYCALGRQYAASGKAAEALAQYRLAEPHIQAALAASTKEANYFNVHANLLENRGDVFSSVTGDAAKQGEGRQAALMLYLQALPIRKKALAMKPSDAVFLVNLVYLYERIGMAQVQLQEWGPAKKSYQEMVATGRRAAARKSGSAALADAVVRGYLGIGAACKGAKDAAGALGAYKDGLAVVDASLSREPNNADLLYRRAVLYEYIGDTCKDRRDAAGALKAYAAMAGAAESAATLSRDNPDRWNYCGNTQHKMGTAVRESDPEQAFNRYGKSLSALRRAIAKAPKTMRYRSNLVILHNDVATLHEKRGDMAAAIEAYRSVLAAARDGLKLEPKNFQMLDSLCRGYYDLARAQVAAGKLEDALETYQAMPAVAMKAIEVDPKALGPIRFVYVGYYGAGQLLLRAGRKDEALQSYREAVKAVRRAKELFPGSEGVARDAGMCEEAVKNLSE